MSINLVPLTQATDRLSEAIVGLSEHQPTVPAYAIYRDAVVTRFNFCYELAFKTLKRYLREYAGLDETYVNEVFRAAARLGLIDELTAWLSYKEQRNLNVHTYRLNQAETTAKLAGQFLADLRALLAALERGLADV